MSNNQNSGASARAWANQKISEGFCQTAKGKLVWDRETKTYWRYDGRIWLTYSMEDDMSDDIYQFISTSDEANRLTEGKVLDIAKLCRRTNFCPKVYGLADKWLSFDDCLLDPDTGETAEHSPERVATVHVSRDYATLGEASCPMFDAFLSDTCRDSRGIYNKVMEAQIYEMIGYLLSPTNAEKCFILYGTGQNGKSVLLDLMRLIIGEDRCNGATIEQLTKQGFNIDGLIGKRANIVDEQEGMADSAATLKRLVSGNPYTTRRIYGTSFTFRPKTKFYFGSNNLPRFDSFDHAIRRRFLIVPFENRLDDKKKIIDLAGKIVAAGEVPAIVKRSLDALRGLVERRFAFTESDQTRKAMNQFEHASSSVAEFLDSRGFYPDENGAKYSFASVYEEYKDWCRTENRKPLMSKNFATTAVERIGETRRFRIDGKATNGYRLSVKKDETEPEPDETLELTPGYPPGSAAAQLHAAFND
jgi:P4 family phage/plasmid primase-like protien